MEILRYLLAALAAGAVAVWASENLFWSAPPADWAAKGMILTWLAYALCAACALSAVAWTGCRGWRGLFLCGAMLGFMVEGVLVDTMYAVFPFQLVWTPLAWHALVTVFAIGGTWAMGRRWPVWRQALAYAGTGLLTGGFGLFWPLERDDLSAMPAAVLVAYLLGWGLTMPPGLWVLGRLGRVPRPHGAVLLVVPALALAVWVAKSVTMPEPVRLAGPVMVGLTVWAMARLGDRRAVTLPDTGPRVWLALLVPLAALAVLVPGYRAFPAGLEANWPFAMLTMPLGLGLWLACLASAARAQRPGPPGAA